MNWIKARLNKDNFWNLMFWLGMTIGMIVSQYFSDDGLVAGVVFWATILSVSFITKAVQSVKVDKRYGFFNCNGRLLNDSLPKRFGLVLFLSIALSAITAFLQLPSILVTALFFLIPTLYFIYINCPVSILFNRYVWQEGSGTGFYTKDYTPSPSTYTSIFPTLSEYKYSPRYSYRGDNIYH